MYGISPLPKWWIIFWHEPVWVRESGPRLNIKPALSGMGIPMLKTRRSRDMTIFINIFKMTIFINIFNIGIPVLVKPHLYIGDPRHTRWCLGPCFNIKTVFPCLGYPYGRETVFPGPSYLYNGEPYTSKTAYLYWFFVSHILTPLVPCFTHFDTYSTYYAKMFPMALTCSVVVVVVAAVVVLKLPKRVNSFDHGF